MALCLSNKTADTILRNLRREGAKLEPASSSVIHDFKPDLSDARDVASAYGVATNESVSVLVGSQGLRRKSPYATTHLFDGQPPEGSFLHLNDDVYLPSPCFCLLLQARELHLVELCQMLGFYMGTEQIEREADGRLWKETLPPLVNEEELSLYLQSAKGARGVSVLGNALRWTCAGAASPKETDLQLALTLPRSYGGFGLKQPIMNYEVNLGETARRLCPKGSCRIDLAWKKRRFGLEFQGKEHGKQLGADYARIYALDTEHWEILFVANEQLLDAEQMRYIASLVARKTGQSPRRIENRAEREIQWLLDVLSGQIHPKIGYRIHTRGQGVTQK